MKLTEYAAAMPAQQRGRCWLCKLPQRGEVEGAKAAGVPWSVMIEWLTQDQGVPDVTRNKLYHHFNERHHEAPA